VQYLADNTINIQTSDHVDNLEKELSEALAKIEELELIKAPMKSPKIAKPKAIKKFKAKDDITKNDGAVEIINLKS
jgi:hypothetical protein